MDLEDRELFSFPFLHPPPLFFFFLKSFMWKRLIKFFLAEHI